MSAHVRIHDADAHHTRDAHTRTHTRTTNDERTATLSLDLTYTIMPQ